MAKKKLFISDQRMLILMDWAIDAGLAKNSREYCSKIKFERNSLSNVKTGHQSFTKQQIFNACILTGASADYIFGFTNTIKRGGSKKPIEMLREAVMAVEGELISKS
jgi:5'-3' exonuclease